jgi:FkbM family methyltransferase
MKEKLKKHIPQPIWNFLRYWKFRIFKRGYFGRKGLDKKLKKYINYKNGFFVELGANDGFTASNTLYFELFKGWRGILVEPSPHLFLSCTEYRNRKGNSIHCNACVPFGYSEKYVDIEYANLMSLSINLDLDIEDKSGFLDKGRAALKDNQKQLRFGALAKNLSTILDESNAPRKIDLLSLDVEGAELDVLKGIDFDKYSFNYIIVECRDIKRMEAFLNEKNYKLLDKLTYHDYLFAK